MFGHHVRILAFEQPRPPGTDLGSAASSVEAQEGSPLPWLLPHLRPS